MRYRDAEILVAEFGVRLVTEPGYGLSGIAVGRKDEGPITAGEDFCVSGFVERKLDGPTLSVINIREFHALMRDLGGGRLVTGPNDVDVVEIGGPIRLHSFRGSDHAKPATVNTQKWFAAPRSGVSICNATGYPRDLDAGTLGFIVEDGQMRYLVSNNHVLARENTANPGEEIVQPGTKDLNGHDIDRLALHAALVGEFKIAELFDFIDVRLKTPNGNQTNKVDVAIAKMTESRSDESHARHGYGGRLEGFGPAYRVDKGGKITGSANVNKVGRTSGYTEGYVANVKATIPLQFGKGTAVFVDQLAVRPGKDNNGVFSTDGDSGAALVTDGHEIVGLIFSGGPRRSLANPIDEIMRALDAKTGLKLQLVK